jgi:glyoxylase-like metal-dependent hydrolase (beta-lactamase superfamily II)
MTWWLQLASPDPASVLDALRAQLGEPSAAIRTTAVVTRVDHGQSVEDEALVRARLHEVRSLGADGDQELHFQLKVAYPYVFPLEWTERIDGGQRGEIDGADTFQGDRHREVSPARLALREKQRLLANPAWLLAGVEPTSVRLDPDGVLLEGRYQEHELRIFIDPADGRLHLIEFVEEFPPLGDVQIDVLYDDWRGEPPVPYWLEERLDGQTVRLELRDRVEAVSLQVELAGEPVPLDPLGWRRSSWFDDWSSAGFPQDDQPTTFALQWREIEPGVHLVSGEFHNVVVVELGEDELVMIEAPHSPELTRAVLDGLQARWPQGKLVAAVVTHRHLDHIGGIQEIARREVPLVVPATETGWFRERLGAAPLVPVADRHVLQGARRSVELHALDNPHARGMLLAWLPDVRLVHTADLLNPGLIPTRGPYGWLARRVLAGLDPANLAKAGTYAQALRHALDQASLRPRRITGGHGPQVARKHALRVLGRYADEALFQAYLKENDWPG